MLDRRNFLKAAGTGIVAAFASRHPLAAEIDGAENEAFHFVSDYVDLQLSSAAPEFLSLNIDGLGKARRGANIVDAKGSGAGFKASSFTSGGMRRVEAPSIV